MNVWIVIPIASLICYSILLEVNFLRSQGGKVNSSFNIYLISMIVWSLGSFLAHLENPHIDTLLWNRFMVIGSAGMPFAFFSFVKFFLRKPNRHWMGWAVFGYIVNLVANFSGWVIESAYVSEGRLVNTYGPAVVIPSLTWLVMIILSAWDLVREYRKTKDVTYRNRIKYVLGVIIVIFGGSITNATSLSVFPIDIGFNVISAFLIAYAILRYQLLDLSVVVRRSLLYSIPTALISLIYFLVLYAVWHVFETFSNFHVILMSLMVAILSAIVAQPIRDKAQLWVDRLFFREKHDVGLMLQRVGRTAASVLESSDLTSMILKEVTAHLHVSKSAIFLKSIDSPEFVLSSQSGMETGQSMSIREDHPVVRWLEANDRVLSRIDIEVIPQFLSLWEREREEFTHLEAELFVAIRAKESLVGILVVGPKRSEETFSNEDYLTLLALASQTAVAIDNARLYAEARQRSIEMELLYTTNLKLSETLRQQAIRDPLTHLFNRRYMEETLERELSRAERNQSSLGIVFLDIDYFKRFNDQYGHNMGDRILLEFGGFLKTHVRKEDIACRYGGEEFVLILPDTCLEVVCQRAEEIRTGVKQLDLSQYEKHSSGITLSIGVSVFPVHGLNAENLLRTADTALYRAKANGRDCVCIAG